MQLPRELLYWCIDIYRAEAPSVRVIFVTKRSEVNSRTELMQLRAQEVGLTRLTVLACSRRFLSVRHTNRKVNNEYQHK